MQQKKKFSVLLIFLLFVIAGAMFAYRYLSDRVAPDTGGRNARLCLHRAAMIENRCKNQIAANARSKEYKSVSSSSRSDFPPYLVFVRTYFVSATKGTSSRG